MGLDAASIGSSSLQRTIRLRMKASGASTVEEFEHLISTSVAEWNQLIEAVVVTETWFFRDRQAFAALGTLILTDWLPVHAAGRVRILSLPCSSGEEPYSIAMALIEAGVPAARFAVEGVDLSQRVLQKAVAGIYGKNSFRGQDLAFRDRHFEVDGDQYAIKPAIRDCVTFRQDNLLGDGFSLGCEAYDFVFCRNLLIYFDRETQRRAFQRLESLLTPGGTLFVGPAEIPLATENGFSSIGLPMAFACRRGQGKKSSHLAPVSRKALSRARSTPAVIPAAPPLLRANPAEPSVVPPPAEALVEARKQADNGRLEDAARLCQAHLIRHGASVDAYYLLGVIHDAMGRPEARDFYRKALYLNPNHYESLLQMALLAEREGDATAARNLRRRAQRLELKVS